MRKITQESVKSFIQYDNFNKSNTTVVCENGQSKMYLFANLIAVLETNSLFITDAGWQSNTTKERLNGILYELNLPRLSQRKGFWYLGDEPFHGRKIFEL